MTNVLQVSHKENWQHARDKDNQIYFCQVSLSSDESILPLLWTVHCHSHNVFPLLVLLSFNLCREETRSTCVETYQCWRTPSWFPSELWDRVQRSPSQCISCPCCSRPLSPTNTHYVAAAAPSRGKARGFYGGRGRVMEVGFENGA